MATVSDLLSSIQYRVDNKVNILAVINTAVRILAKRLYWHKSELLKETFYINFSPVTYTAATISFANDNPDTINDSASGFGSFTSGQEITISGSTDNDGTVQTTAITAAAMTLAIDETLTAEAAGSSVTLTSDRLFAALPSDFWGMLGKPYIKDKDWFLEPLPGLDVKLNYHSTTGLPKYYEVRGAKLYLTPRSSSDITVIGDYFARPTQITAKTDTLPFNELFDDTIAEFVIIFAKDGPISSMSKQAAMREFMHEAVDALVGIRGEQAIIEFQNEENFDIL